MNKFLMISVLVMLGVTSLALFATKDSANSLPADSTSGKAAIGGAFTLTDKDGTSRNDDEFRGKVMMVFFGFTHCPDICPISLATYTAVLKDLGGKAEKVAPIFISVDPQSDTPARLTEYMANFDPRIVAFTGTEAQVKQVTDAYKAFYSPPDTHGMVNHSGLIYLMNEKGEYVKHFGHDVAADVLKKAVEELVK